MKTIIRWDTLLYINIPANKSILWQIMQIFIFKTKLNSIKFNLQNKFNKALQIKQFIKNSCSKQFFLNFLFSVTFRNLLPPLIRLSRWPSGPAIRNCSSFTLCSNRAASATTQQVCIYTHHIKYIYFSSGLYFYLYKGKPGMLDLKGKAKWNAWNDKKGMTQDAAKTSYVKYVEGLVAKYS